MAADTKLALEPQTSEETIAEKRSLLDIIAEEGKIGQTDEERSSGKMWLSDLVRDVMSGQMTVSRDTEAMLNSRIKDLDELISRQLNEVMHAEPLQKLEGSWRGLKYLVQQTETSSSLKIKLLNVSKKDLFKDLDKATEFDQSVTFKKIYEEDTALWEGIRLGCWSAIMNLLVIRRT